MKRCCRCKAEAPLDQFCKDRQQKDGLSARCRSCRNELSRLRKAANPERAKAYANDYLKRNPDKRREAMRRWREKNPDWRRQWNAANPEKAKAWDRANPDKVREKYLRRRALKRAVTVGEVDLEALWVTNEGRCQLCGDPIDRSLKGPHPMSASVDHIIPLAKGGTHEQSNLQWTHLVENQIKGTAVPAS